MPGAAQLRPQIAGRFVPGRTIAGEIGETREALHLAALERRAERVPRRWLAREILPEPVPELRRIAAERDEQLHGGSLIAAGGQRPKQGIARGRLRRFAHGGYAPLS